MSSPLNDKISELAEFSLMTAVFSTYLILYTVNPLTRPINKSLNSMISKNREMMAALGLAITGINAFILFTIMKEEVNYSKHQVNKIRIRLYTLTILLIK